MQHLLLHLMMAATFTITIHIFMPIHKNTILKQKPLFGQWSTRIKHLIQLQFMQNFCMTTLHHKLC